MGTGIIRMGRAMETAGLKKPVYQKDSSFFKIIFERDLSENVTKDVTKEENVTKDVVKEEKEMQLKIIDIIKKDSVITTTQMAQELNISRRQIQRLLNTMTDSGIIKRTDGRKHGYWLIL
jgi:predicted HTH transcriptional regulator